MAVGDENVAIENLRAFFEQQFHAMTESYVVRTPAFRILY